MVCRATKILDIPRARIFLIGQTEAEQCVVAIDDVEQLWVLFGSVVWSRNYPVTGDRGARVVRGIDCVYA